MLNSNIIRYASIQSFDALPIKRPEMNIPKLNSKLHVFILKKHGVLMGEKKELIEVWKKSGMIKDTRVLDAFNSIRREDFVPAQFLDQAYGDYPLPIGYEATISQPSTIMMMLEYLEVKKDDKVLEIGAGSGYNAALLSKLAKKVITVDNVKQLAEMAKRNLKKANIKNAKVIYGDGSFGYVKQAPYDRIIITAGMPNIPQELFDQLKVGGIILAPIGPMYSQEMTKVTKTETGYKFKELGAFMFVPLKGKHGY